MRIVGDTQVPGDPVRLRPAVRRDLTTPAVTPPPSIFDVSTQDDARSPRHLSYLFRPRVYSLYAPVPRQTCTSDAPTRQTGLPGYRVSFLHVPSARQASLTVCLPCPYVRAAFRICKCRRRKALSRGRHVLTEHLQVGVGENLQRYISVPPLPEAVPQDALPFRPTSPRLVSPRPLYMPLPLRVR